MNEVKLPPLPELGPEWTLYWSKVVHEKMQAYARAAIEANTQDVPDCKVVDLGFRWDADRQEHVPKLVVEFDAVPHNGPSDAKGWADRDALAALLAASPQPAPHPVQEEPVAWLHVCQKRPELRDLSFTWEWPERKAKGFKPKPLYTHPAPQTERVPLTDEQIIREGLLTTPLAVLHNIGDTFKAGARYAEAAHNITKKGANTHPAHGPTNLNTARTSPSRRASPPSAGAQTTSLDCRATTLAETTATATRPETKRPTLD